MFGRRKQASMRIDTLLGKAASVERPRIVRLV